SLLRRPAPASTLFPYTTLFRSVLGDVRRLAQVGNLLLAHACATARRQVRFRTGPGQQPGGAEWSVTDDGPGLPAEQLEKAFVPLDRKSTRLNSSHDQISYAVFC